MSKLNAKQITQIADNLVAIARVFGDYIVAHQLSIKGRLGNLHAAILDRAAELYQLSAIEIGEEVETAIEELDSLTNEIQERYEKLDNLKMMVSLATAVLTMSTALIGRDIKAFIQAVKDLQMQRYPEND
jgi:hypothetical protein